MSNKGKIRLHQLMRIMREGTACFSISDDNEHRYCEECSNLEELQEEPWYKEIMDCPVIRITTIGGGIYRVETCIVVSREGAKHGD